MAKRLPLFATCARGTEDLLREELEELGVAKIRQDRGGVRFSANLDEALRAALWTRIAMRVLYPLGEFEAQSADEVYEAAKQVPWEEHLTTSSTFAVDATLQKGETGHSGFLGLKIKDALVDRLRQKLGSRPDVDTKSPDVSVVAHFGRGRLSLSLDLGGEALHRRGYRVRPTPAPLKETLAAAILRAGKYTGEEPLVDPMCGSGTLLIEAGLIAERRAPGMNFPFAVERWPHLGKQSKEILDGLRADALRQQRKAPQPIWGFDKSEDAVDAARRNVIAAKLQAAIRVEPGDATKPLVVPEPPGVIVTNPPYGDRLGSSGGQKGMKTFYFQLGEAFGELHGWRFVIFSGNPAFESAFHHRPIMKRVMWNGPIDCELLEYPKQA